MTFRLFKNFTVTIYPKSHVVPTLWVEYIGRAKVGNL